jgi:hypothetical protein
MTRTESRLPFAAIRAVESLGTGGRTGEHRSIPVNRGRHMKAALAVALGAATLLCAAPPAAAVSVGIADSDGDTFADPNWPGLSVTMGRAVAPYDVALTAPVAGTPAGDRRIEFDQWVFNAAATGVQPLVTFEASRDPSKRTPDGLPLAPTVTEYSRAMRAFLTAYPSVRRLAPWNEPNFTGASNPLSGSPSLAASYYRRLVAVCRRTLARCTVAAGEFAGVPGDAYVDGYKAALGRSRPAVWAFHAHTDANRFQAGTDSTAPATRFFLTKLGGKWARSRIWIDEVGAYYRDADGKVWGDDSQRATTSFILGLSSLSPRIARIYYYNLSNECSTATRCAVQDRGVVSPSPWDGTPLGYDIAGRTRANYTVIKNRGPLITPHSPRQRRRAPRSGE